MLQIKQGLLHHTAPTTFNFTFQIHRATIPTIIVTPTKPAYTQGVNAIKYRKKFSTELTKARKKVTD